MSWRDLRPPATTTPNGYPYYYPYYPYVPLLPLTLTLTPDPVAAHDKGRDPAGAAAEVTRDVVRVVIIGVHPRNTPSKCSFFWFSIHVLVASFAPLGKPWDILQLKVVGAERVLEVP